MPKRRLTYNKTCLFSKPAGGYMTYFGTCLTLTQNSDGSVHATTSFVFISRYSKVGISFTMSSPYSRKGAQSEILLNTCIAHSNSADLFSFNKASDWLRRDCDNKTQ